jgi:hypothetical protein
VEAGLPTQRQSSLTAPPPGNPAHRPCPARAPPKRPKSGDARPQRRRRLRREPSSGGRRGVGDGPPGDPPAPPAVGATVGPTAVGATAGPTAVGPTTANDPAACCGAAVGPTAAAAVGPTAAAAMGAAAARGRPARRPAHRRGASPARRVHAGGGGDRRPLRPPNAPSASVAWHALGRGAMPDPAGLERLTSGLADRLWEAALKLKFVAQNKRLLI